ncbi:sulfatase-like hydrolase/transferase [Pelagicoccus sp. NFK12]|uniref:Sulfatase-like hydrolase/transferase n=1 Tax=Pelagicoccus enzymogenes TaxID=2773457 RepID=A0A927IHT5_9BACT|nr:sulfatase-like hydrolase/transferase [Pelagicoccus enzymogenes]
MNRDYLKIIAKIVFMAVVSFPLQAEKKPNFLITTVNYLNDWIGPLGGHPQTLPPNFDRLASRGATITNAHCSIPICSASRSSFMSGLKPEKTGVFTNGNSFSTYLRECRPSPNTLPTRATKPTEQESFFTDRGRNPNLPKRTTIVPSELEQNGNSYLRTFGFS